MNIIERETKLAEIKGIIPYFLKHKTVWANYDEEADVLYLHFKKTNEADNAELMADDVIVRYEAGIVIGITIMNASQNQSFS